MGLLYQFPVKEDELDDRITIEENSVLLKTYGLPMIFWGYFIAILATLIIMYLAIAAPIESILNSDDQINQLIAFAVLALFIAIPFSLLVMLSYEKHLLATADHVKIIHKVFGLTLLKRTIRNNSTERFQIEYFDVSPNIAKIENSPEYRGFQNRGHHILYLLGTTKKRIYLDRSGRVSDLEKIKSLFTFNNSNL